MFDSVVIGGGPSGASCALWLKLMGLRPCIVERAQSLGGLQNDSPYPNEWIASVMDKDGMRIAADIHAHVMKHRIDCRLGRGAVGLVQTGDAFRVDIDGGDAIEGKALVLASGVRPVSGGFVASPKVLIGPGSQIAARDYRGQRVAILGGGDNAFENYLFVRERGAESARIFTRSVRTRKEFLDRVPPEDVQIGTFLADNDHSAAAWRDYDLILVMYGWEAHVPYLGALQLARDPRGFVQVDAECRTSIKGVYAVGEVTRRAHPCCATAIADGVIAAKSIQQSLEQDVIARYVAAAKRASESRTMPTG
ncbi:MAG: NAD(P)/FAD-dependent oxidoreductase [Lysobacteraceae bacterium]|nr:MAG: NAD(P)/FAD-dependent oxidoreductase [Xanthomonadaceae bacterium]